MGLTALPLGGEHLSETFQRYLDWKERRIVQHLRMDPALRPVNAAIAVFSKALVEANSDGMPYAAASALFASFGNGLHQWPDTLFGQLLSEDVLSRDVTWDFETNEAQQVVRFTYQQFADYQVVSILLDSFDGDAESLQQALSPGEPLHQTILDAPPNWIEALAVLVPERFRIELQDAAEWDPDGYIRHVWDSALVTSVALRQPSAVTERTRELLGDAQRRSWDPQDVLFEIWLTAATQPEHLLNADALHEALKGMSMPDRDAAWSMSNYYTLDNGGALDRLIRWASRSIRPDCPREVVKLAAITLAWTFTSPNRRLRDQATKALAQLLSTHLSVLPTLIRRFAGVNDPYVIERLAVSCHGAVLCGGTSDPQTVVSAAEELKRVVFADDQPPNFIARDAVRGIYEWCFHSGWIDAETYTEILPPYSSDPPGEPPTEEEIRRDYHVLRRGAGRERPPYSEIFWSVFDMGDSGRYVIGSGMRNFTPHTLGKPIPKGEQRTVLPAAWAQRWVFQRVISLGWTPEHFAEFDQRVNHWLASRTDHKPERFGKKYQWIAFHELMARIADNFHMTSGYDREPVAYEGPWQLLEGRDIDPTLPPPLRTRNADDELEVGATFAADGGLWWLPQGPRYRDDDPTAGDGWGTESHDLPEFEQLVRRKDDEMSRWVVLHAWYSWVDELAAPTFTRSRPREFWSHIYSWLVQPKQCDAVVAFLERRSLMNKLMPEGARQIDDAYLGEVPWATSASDADRGWESIRIGNNWTPTGLEVVPVWEEYCWEGNILDCSMEDGVQGWYPAFVLFQAGHLVWKPGTREWRDPSGATVAQFMESNGQSVLLVREDWLRQTLRNVKLNIVFGWLGEKRLLEKRTASSPIETIGSWTEINATASLKGRRWMFGQRRLTERSPSKR